jgi:hypothetical protein
MRRKKIVKEAFKILGGKAKNAQIPKYSDGKTVEGIVKILVEEHLRGW